MVLGVVAVSGTNSAGTVTWRQKHTPFGEELNAVAANKDEIDFTGHIKDSDTGLNYMQARYYDPVIGRFYSNDPAGFTASNPMMFNRYAYANNNPYKFVDPDGKKAESFFVQGKTYENVGQAVSGAWGDPRQSLDSGVQNSIPNVEVTAENIGTISDGAALGASVSLAAGQPQAAAVLGTFSLVTGVTEAMMSENPQQGLIIEAASTITSLKSVGVVVKIASGAIEGAPTAVKNVVAGSGSQLQTETA
uniref:RHS repeat-associated core domain-containing protein n=1 Tax=Arsukibacterium sp. TaxID=1977258 RepID=UPI003566F328